MLKRTGFIFALASLLAACAGASGGMQRALSPAHASGEGLGGPTGATGAAPTMALEHRHY